MSGFIKLMVQESISCIGKLPRIFKGLPPSLYTSLNCDYFGMNMICLCQLPHVVGNNLDRVLRIICNNAFQFLMGLNETYNVVRSQILLLNPLPSVNHVYSMLVQEKSQRQHSPNDIGSDPVSFHSAHMVQKKRFNSTCDHCKIKGHKRENCYRLIGHPADFKFTK